MRFGCCVGLDRMQRVQDAGYDYIELTVGTVKPEQADSEFEPVRELLDSFDIRPEAWNCLLPGSLKMVGLEVDLYRAERYLRTAFQRIEEVGGETVVFGSGGARRVPDGFPMDEARDQLCEALTLAGQVAGAYGITIALEPLASTATNIINTLPQGADLVKRVDHPFVRLLADLQHMVDEGEPTSVIGALDVEIVHAHTADTDRLYPGSGSYPTREFIQALKAAGYDDRLSVECVWRDFDTECPKALEFLRELDART
jgi:sugar phosphate isomerase/epimerase